MRESNKVYGWGVYRHLIETIWRPSQHVLRSSSAIAIFSFLALSAGVLFAVRLLDQSTFLSLSGKSFQDVYQKPQTTKEIIIPLNCSFVNLTRSCPLIASYYPSSSSPANINDHEAPSTCPDYFRWLYDDLWVWRKTGISREMVMSAKRTANFRLVIVNGTAYVEKYRKAFQTRDTFTLWGILQLLRRYPGKVPDLDLMFDCGDRPVIKFKASNNTNTTAPPLFSYCADDQTLDISFPDWSFWGWPEVNIKPWEGLLKDLKQGNEKINWVDREPYAYWKGNPLVDETRKDLLTCNVSETQDWGARLYSQNWVDEEKHGFNRSNLANQCRHKYKIYIEGVAWSVSEKYILACDSLTLLVKPRFHDFFSRGLVPLKHYWPINTDDKCRSIKHAVEWGNTHPQQAQDVGKGGSKFIEEELKMEYVYDYMFHVLTHYAKLLTYKPRVPPKAVRVCSEVMLCRHASGLEKEFMVDSLVNAPSRTPPCIMPPPFDPAALHSFLHTKQNSIKLVDSWENQYWNTHQNTNRISSKTRK